MTAIKKLKYIKKNVLNILLLIFTLSLTMVIPVFNSANRILSKKEQYKPQKFIINDFKYISTGNSGSPVAVSLYGKINNNKVLLGADPNYNFKIGDTVYVWYDSVKDTRERYPNETHTDFVKRFEKFRNNIIIFVFIPYILLWLIKIKKCNLNN